VAQLPLLLLRAVLPGPGSVAFTVFSNVCDVMCGHDRQLCAGKRLERNNAGRGMGAMRGQAS
jgi:hypothetical protein